MVSVIGLPLAGVVGKVVAYAGKRVVPSIILMGTLVLIVSNNTVLYAMVATNPI